MRVTEEGKKWHILAVKAYALIGMGQRSLLDGTGQHAYSVTHLSWYKTCVPSATQVRGRHFRNDIPKRNNLVVMQHCIHRVGVSKRPGVGRGGASCPRDSSLGLAVIVLKF